MSGVGRVKTRHRSGGALADFLEPGRALLPTELPTLRATLRQGLLFKEERIHMEDTMKTGRSYSSSLPELVTDMTQALTTHYLKANVEFQPPVVISEKAIKQNLTRA